MQRALERWTTVQGGLQKWAVATKRAAPLDPFLTLEETCLAVTIDLAEGRAVQID